MNIPGFYVVWHSWTEGLIIYTYDDWNYLIKHVLSRIYPSAIGFLVFFWKPDLKFAAQKWAKKVFKAQVLQKAQTFNIDR